MTRLDDLLMLQSGVVARRQLLELSHLDDRVQWNLTPPRVRIKHAVLQLAAECRDEVEAAALLADAVQARRTTAGRLLTASDAFFNWEVGRGPFTRAWPVLPTLGSTQVSPADPAVLHKRTARIAWPVC